MIHEVTTKYKQEFTGWLNNEAEMQKLGLSKVFNWQWFITMTSKDVMTKNGARLAMTRFLGLYLQETKTEEVTCFWVAEPHNQGKTGYHIHAILETKWPVPKERARELQLALMLDDIYQRAMGVSPGPIDSEGKTQYFDKFGRMTNKHRFRAEPYSNARGAYCAKYITKGAILWEFARVTQSEARVTATFDEEGTLENLDKDCKGNWNKKKARLRTKELIRAMSFRKGHDLLHLSDLIRGADLNFAKFAKFRANKREIEITMAFEPKAGVKVYS